MSTDEVKNRNQPKRQSNNDYDTQRRERNPYTRKRAPIFWGELSPDAIGRFVARVCDAGCGCVLGRTSDGGALSITIMDGSERIREWPTSDRDFEDFADWCDISLPDVSYKPPTNSASK